MRKNLRGGPPHDADDADDSPSEPRSSLDHAAQSGCQALGHTDGPTSEPSPDASSGTSFGALIAGRYRLRRRIAVGGLATVYEAVIADLGKRVAIKFIDESYAESEEIVERFRLEARAASAIESEHIVHVFDVGEDPRYGLYMVMELLQGEDLGKRLDREGRVEADVAAAIALQASWALAKAHDLGIVHRDLKPENLFLVERAAPGVFVKLLDFGIAKLTRELGVGMRDLTARGSTLGTPQYMSPEQIQAAPDLDARTDIWSLGAVLFEALAGRPVFEEKATFAETLLQICRDRPPRLADVAPWVPEALAEIVDSALEPDRQKRLPDARTFATRLLEAVPDLLASAFAPSSLLMAARALSAQTPPPSSRRLPPPVDAHVLRYDADRAEVKFREFGEGESEGRDSMVFLGPAGTTVPLVLTPLPTRAVLPNARDRISSIPPSSSSQTTRQYRSVPPHPSSLPPNQGYAVSVAPGTLTPSGAPARVSYAPLKSLPPRRGTRRASLFVGMAATLVLVVSIGGIAIRRLTPAPAALDLRAPRSARVVEHHHAAQGAPRGRIDPHR